MWRGWGRGGEGKGGGGGGGEGEGEWGGIRGSLEKIRSGRLIAV